ncbi:MAG: histidine phosphatase family protein [Hyphomicrobiaceae bacterium]|jgi:probable phosphoglycerate mutase
MLRPGVTIYFIRHGETDWNRDRRYQGQMDIPLNATGRAQAARNGKVLATALGARAAGLDYVASPLERARETMQIVRGGLGLLPDAYRTDDRLKEVHYGHWEGQLQDELRTRDPEGLAARDLDAWGWIPRGGESYEVMSRRVAGWLGEVARDTVVCAHGGTMRALRRLALDIPPAQVPTLPVPQDQVLVLSAGAARWL